MSKGRNLCELCLVLIAIGTASFASSWQGNNVGKGEAVRTSKGAASGGAVMAVLAAYKLYRGKD